MKKEISNVIRGVVLASIALVGLPLMARENGYDWELVNDGALVVSSAEDQFDTNKDISFPSIIAVPSWVEKKADPSARYYLYYAEHHGDAISMKWAADITGPWHAFNTPGTGGNGNTLRGVMDFIADSSRHAANGIDENGNTYGPGKKLDGGWSEYWRRGHVAAPDVFIDEENKVFVMAWHGKTGLSGITMDSGEETDFFHTGFVAFSRDGLNFNDPETGGGQPGRWGPQDDRLPFGPLEQEGLFRGKMIQRTQPLMLGGYSRLLKIRNQFYAISSQGVISTPRDPARPWARPDTINPNELFTHWWVEQDHPGTLWEGDSRWRAEVADGREYVSIIDGFFRSSLFADHPHNPCPGHAITGKAKVNHPEVVKLSDDRLEIYIYIRVDGKPDYPIDDPFRDLMRVELDVSDPDWNNWTIARHDDTGEYILDVVCKADDLRAAVKKAIGKRVDGLTHADPVSMGAPGVITVDSIKYCFVGFKSEDVNPDYDHSEGQIACLKLIPTNNGVWSQRTTGSGLKIQDLNHTPVTPKIRFIHPRDQKK